MQLEITINGDKKAVDDLLERFHTGQIIMGYKFNAIQIMYYSGHYNFPDEYSLVKFILYQDECLENYAQD